MRPLASTPSNICKERVFSEASHFSAVFARFSGLFPLLTHSLRIPWAGCTSVVLAKSLNEIRRAAQPALVAEQEPSKAETRRPARTRAIQQTQLARQEERQQRYQTIIALHHQGMKSREIAARVGMGERTVRHWLSSRGLPYSHLRKPRPRLIDPYLPYLLARWQEGCRKGSQLEKEVRARGYTGSQRGIYRYLETLEASSSKGVSRRFTPPSVEVSIPLNAPLTLSVQQATWLFFRKRADLKEVEIAQLNLLLQANERAKTAYYLVETFLDMVRTRTGERLDAWLEAVQASQLEAFTSFVTSIQQDKDAVLAGLTLPWSTGPLEGHINRLKLIKRQGYGRAKFDLLRLRVLHHPRKRPNEKKQNTHQQEGKALKNQKTRETNQTSQHTTYWISRAA